MTESLAGRVLAGRYEVRKVLGQGAMGQVWLARQIQLDRDVAIKVLRTSGPVQARARRRLHREARLVARISHPHVVQVYDYGETADGAPFLVMEFIDGLDAVRPMGACSSLPAILGCADAILSALEAAHARGVLHRDLKPANMVLRGGDPEQVVLLDFGIAAILGRDNPASSYETTSGAHSQLTREGTVVGTPLYMSPEQAQGMPATEASDVYAVGVMLYEWLCGQPPFVGSAEEVMRAHVFRLPGALVPKEGVELPEGLEAVVGRALAKRPDARFPSAAAMRAALQAVVQGPAPGVPRPAIPLDSSRNDSTLELSAPGRSRVGLARLAEAPFAGRLKERHWLHDRVQAALETGGVIVVEGEEGVGKTRLVEEVLREPSLHARFGQASLPPGGAAPLAVLRRALADLLGVRGLTRDALDGRLSALLGSSGASGPFGLAEAERGRLADWLRPGGDSRLSRHDPLDSARDGELLERALRAQASREPVILLLDDLQWADSATARFLLELTSSLRLAPAPLVLLLCRRPADGADPLVGLLRYEGELVERLALARLSRSETEQLLRGHSPLSPTTASVLAARADGSPLFAVQLLRTLQQRELLVEGPDGLESRASEEGLPASLAQILDQRLDRAGPESEAVLHAAAVLGHAFDVEVLEDVLEAVGGSAAPDTLDDALDQLVEARVLLEPAGGGDRLAWEHPLLRQLVLERTRKSRRRRRLCKAAAQALGEAGPARPVVELYLLAGERGAAAPHAARAGEEALAGGEFAEARRLFELAIDEGPREDVPSALWGLGTAENHLGHVDRAEQAFRRMLDAGPQERDAAWAWYGVGRCEYIRGAHRTAVSSLDRALELARQGEGVALQCRILRTMAAAAAELPERPFPDLSQLPEVDDPAQQVEVLKTAGFVALSRGEPGAAAETFERALAQARALGSDPSLADLLCDLGRACRSAGDAAAAREHLREALRLSRGPGQHRTEAEVLNELGELARASGDLEAAARHYAEAVQIWAALDSRLVVVGTLNQALVAVDRERFEEAKELVTDLRRRPEGIPEHLATPFLLTTALAAVGAGYPDAARMAFQQALEQLQGGPALEPETTRVLRQLAELARAGGATDLADGVAEAIRRFSPGVPTTA